MRISKIYSDRYFEQWPSWQPVYEWEDVFASELNLNIIDSSRACIVSKFADRILVSLSRRMKLKDNKLLKMADLLNNADKGMYFEMFQKGTAYRFSTSRNIVPCLIDVWKNQDWDAFCKTYENSPLVLISSREVYDYLKQEKFPLNIRHFPLSIADKYKIDFADSPVKIYDIILAGRVSPVLKGYFQQYLEKYPDTEYLYARHIDGQIHFESNKKGMIGNFHKREDYISLLRNTKAAFYSTPSAGDDDRSTIGNFSQVTPRLFEFAAAGCYIIANYPKNPDTDYYRLNEFYPCVTSYDNFEKELQTALSSDIKEVLSKNAEFLSDHYTSKRVQLLTCILK